MKKRKFWIHYTEENTPKVEGFVTNDELKEFMLEFLLSTQADRDGNWVDLTFEGMPMFIDEGVKEE